MDSTQVTDLTARFRSALLTRDAETLLTTAGEAVALVGGREPTPSVNRNRAAVLMALLSAPAPLRVGQVMPRAIVAGFSASDRRLGQILAELATDGLALRRLHPARGGAAYFYELTPLGVDTARRALESTLAGSVSLAKLAAQAHPRAVEALCT